MKARQRRSLNDTLWMNVGRLFRPSSEWQVNSLARGITMVLMVAAALVFSNAVVHGVFSYFANNTRTFAEIEVGAFFGLIMLVAGWMNWRLYHKGYELREEPVDTTLPPDSHGQWECLYGPLAGNGDALSPENVESYANEFFFNALVNPRSVFSRISEYVEPGRKMLDCRVEYEVRPLSGRKLRILGINDLSVSKREACDVRACFLTVPVSFQKRGDLTIKLRVTNSSGTALPTVKHAEISDYIISMIEGYRFSSGETLEGGESWEFRLKRSLRRYLNNVEVNEDCSVPEQILSVMRRLSASQEDQMFSERVFYMLSGLKDVIPVCISLHAACIEAPKVGEYCADAFPPRVFGLCLEHKCETEHKPSNVLPNVGGSRVVAFLNRIIGRFGRRSDTVYYNLARAGRSTSYHLYLEGPEGTYYARGSLLKENPEDERKIHAEYVEMQKRYGQRHAHIYIRNGHLMSNTTFMFRYKKAPLDTYHIMFVAAFLCLAVLSVSAITSIDAIGARADSESALSNLSVPAMILAVATAAGPWIYNRTSDGKGDSLGVELSAVVLTLCSATAIVLFFATAQYFGPVDGTTVRLWSLLVAIMVINAAFVGYVALLHSSLYQYLVDKALDDASSSSPAPSGPAFKEVENGVRLDTPQGRATKNPYGLWTEALRACRNAHILRYERADELW